MSFAQAVVQYCAPTLAGIKTGNIFSIQNGSSDILGEIRRLNACFTKKGVRIIPIRKTEKKTLIYIYRPERLKADLNVPEAADILKEKGYCLGNPDTCLVQLVRHLAADQNFPHEIGLFLGYPPSDVKCFMENSREGVKCTGCWKAYSNPEKAEETFEKYRKCTAVYCREAKKGRKLETMVVKTGL